MITIESDKLLKADELKFSFLLVMVLQGRKDVGESQLLLYS